MTFQKINCFKTYDVRGKIGKDFNKKIVYRIARALSDHFDSSRIVIGYDARETSLSFAKVASQAVIDSGSDVLNIGMVGTEEMYWAVTEFKCCAGIEITASHNPIGYSGLKMVKSSSRPLDYEHDFLKIKELAQNANWKNKKASGNLIDVADIARKKYVKKILSFVNIQNFRKLKVLVNCGNGAAGPTFLQLASEILKLGGKLDFVPFLDTPDSTFPYGIPNPLLSENQAITANQVIKNKADVGIAFDGDFDRCFFFDEKGNFVPGEYLVGLLAEIFLLKEANSKIIYDPRVTLNILDVVKKNNGIAVQSKTGHSFFKENMRKYDAIYGGEMSAHHYFRDFAFCDSGLIPCFLIIEHISLMGRSLGELIQARLKQFPSSGEKNFFVRDPDYTLDKIFQRFFDGAMIDKSDGISFEYKTWRFNIRKSNTEPLVRLNVESKGSKTCVQEKVELITSLIVDSDID